MAEKIKRGGKRKGAGRKPADYKTNTIAFRVRVDWIPIIRQIVKTKIQQLKDGNN